MTGRGIDQVLPHPGNPVLYESYVRDAREYAHLAERASGPIPRPVDFWPNKEVLYRMHPQNIACLTAARIDCCCLANNHLLDWGYEGLSETVRALDRAGIAHAGAGEDRDFALLPAALDSEASHGSATGRTNGRLGVI